MAKAFSKVGTVAARFIKGAMVAVVIPLAIGLILGMLDQLELLHMDGASARQWMLWGFTTYVGLHIILYRPVGLFRASHRVFSTIAVWLFGGQVASVESAKGSGGKSGGKGVKGEGAAQGSTLVAFSPYVIPSFTVLVCAAAWVAGRWVEPSRLEAPLCFFAGLTLAFHWLMTADELQQQRERWHIETYLLAVGLIIVLTVLLAAAALPLGLPEFSFARALADGLAKTQAIYASLIHELFL